MAVQHWLPLYIGVLFAGAAISLALAFTARRRKDTQGSQAYAALMAFMALHILSRALLLVTRNPHLATFCEYASHAFEAVIAAVYLVFVLRYIGWEELVAGWRLPALFVIPVITAILSLTNDLHGWVIQTLAFNVSGPVTTLDLWEAGPWFWVHTVYGYGVGLLGIMFLLHQVIQSKHPSRRQAGLLALGSLAVAAAILADFLKPAFGGWGVFAQLHIVELMPISYMLFSIPSMVASFRYRFLDITPIVRDTLIDSMPDGVIVVDRQKRVVDLNPAAETLIGTLASEAVGQPIRDLFDSWHTILTGCHDSLVSQAEVTLGQGDTERHFDLHITRLYRRENDPVGCLIVMRDVTERRRSEDERERLISDLDAFAFAVAHDLKNPLSLIEGYAEMLAADFRQATEITEEDRKFIEGIQRAAAKTTDIIESLLLLSRMRTIEEIALEPLDMAAIVENARQRMEGAIAYREAEVTVPDRWPLALGQAAWVEQVWMNYLSNALKYGGDPPRVALGADTQPDGMIRFWVRDSGRGLTVEEQAQLFTPFHRLDNGKVAGHGIGLSIVQRIVTRLGGQVGVESAAGEGSTFWFTLPAAGEGASKN